MTDASIADTATSSADPATSSADPATSGMSQMTIATLAARAREDAERLAEEEEMEHPVVYPHPGEAEDIRQAEEEERRVAEQQEAMEKRRVEMARTVTSRRAVQKQEAQAEKARREPIIQAIKKEMRSEFETLKNEMFQLTKDTPTGQLTVKQLQFINEKLLVLEPDQIDAFYMYLGKKDDIHTVMRDDDGVPRDAARPLIPGPNFAQFIKEYGPALTKRKQQPLSQQQEDHLNAAIKGLSDTSTGAGYRKRRTKKRTRKSKRSKKRKSGRKTRSRKRRTRKRRY